MKRDMDLVRLLLLDIENTTIPPGATATIGGYDIEIDGYDGEQIGQHLMMLVDGGFIAVTGPVGMDGRYPMNGLSWEGHEFLDTIRSEPIWSKAKSQARSLGLWSARTLWELAKEAVKQEIRRHIGSP